MGVLRFFLAFLVVYGHCGSPFGGIGLSAQNAVQSFYLISGFYMTLVLREKYGREGAAGIKSFYLNRWLRLYPSYLVILVLALSFCLFAKGAHGWEPPPGSYLRSWLATGVLDWPKAAAMAVSQLTMIGLDGFNLLTLNDDGTFALTSGASSDKYPLWHLLLVPQAWSLSIELYFYMLAPLIVMRSLRTVLYFAIASYGARLALYSVAGYHLDPWSYRFFPSELMFFLAGAIAYHAYARSKDFQAAAMAEKAAIYLLMGAMIGSAVWMARMGQPQSLKFILGPAFTLGVFLAIPALFRFTRGFKTDRLIGELSYPIYISHILVIWVVGQGGYHTGKGGFLLVGAITIALSYALYRWVDVPIDNYRHRRLGPAQVAAARSGGAMDGTAALPRHERPSGA